MLSLTREAKSMLGYAGNHLANTHKEQVPPIPVAGFAYSLLGRLHSLRGVVHGPAFIANIQAMSVQTALKKAQVPPRQSAHPSGHLAPEQLAALRPQARTPDELAAVARAAENPFWLPEIRRHVETHGDALPCRYIRVEDPLHTNSISRFHVLVKRVANEPAATDSNSSSSSAAAAAAAAACAGAGAATGAGAGAGAGTAAAAAASTTEATATGANGTGGTGSDSTAVAPTAAAGVSASGVAPKLPFRYYIMDLGSLNGLYIDGIKIRHSLWTPLSEGARIRFAPKTKLAREYTAAIQAADVTNRRSLQASIAAGGTGAPGTYHMVGPHVPLVPLSVQDLHIEYVFTHGVNADGQMQLDLLNRVAASGPEVNGALQASLGAAAHSFMALPSMDTSCAKPATNKVAAPVPSHAAAAAAAGPAAAAAGPAAAAAGQAAAAAGPAAAVAGPAAAAAGPAAAKSSNDSSSSSSGAASRKRHLDLDTVSQQEEKRARTSAPGELSTSARAACEEDELLPLTYISAPACGGTAGASGAAAATSQSHAENVFAEFTCGICTETIYKFVALGCGHSFCGGCIGTWFTNKKQVCPICREVHEGNLRPVRSVDNVIEMMVQQNCTAAEKAERAARIIKDDADAKEAEQRQAQRLLGRALAGDDAADMIPLPAPAMRAGGPVPYGELRAEPLPVEDDAGSIIHQFAPAAAAPVAAAAAAAAAHMAHLPGNGMIGARSYHIELSPNGRSRCRCCNVTLARYEMRLKEHMASADKYFHLRCFVAAFPAVVLRGRMTGLSQLPAIHRFEVEATL